MPEKEHDGVLETVKAASIVVSTTRDEQSASVHSVQTSFTFDSTTYENQADAMNSEDMASAVSVTEANQNVTIIAAEAGAALAISRTNGNGMTEMAPAADAGSPSNEIQDSIAMASEAGTTVSNSPTNGKTSVSGGETVEEHDASMYKMETRSTASWSGEEEQDSALDALEMGVAVNPTAPAYVTLRTELGKRAVPNACAICLCTYEEGETVVWSPHRACQHAFHEECVVEWFVKMQDGTPCPCCRQEFTDLEQYKKKKTQVLYTQRLSFDVSVIRL